MLLYLGVAIDKSVKIEKFPLTCQTACLKTKLRPCKHTNISGSITNKALLNCKRKVLENRNQNSQKDFEWLHSWDSSQCERIDVRKSWDTCRFNNPLVTLPTFTTTAEKWFEAVRVAKVLSKTTKHNFFLRYSLLCVKWSHLKVWISTSIAFLVVSMFLLLHKGKFFSVRHRWSDFHRNTKEKETLIVARWKIFQMPNQL